MGKYNDDDRADAYNRYVYTEFANIVQHYDDTARPDHDDIDFDSSSIDDLDGAEYDYDGNRVEYIDDLDDVICNIVDAITHYGSFANIPDDYDFGIDDTTSIEFFDDDDECTDDDCDVCNGTPDDAGFIVIHVYRARRNPDKKP